MLEPHPPTCGRSASYVQFALGGHFAIADRDAAMHGVAGPRREIAAVGLGPSGDRCERIAV
jgi:hypothetical protein